MTQLIAEDITGEKIGQKNTKFAFDSYGKYLNKDNDNGFVTLVTEGEFFKCLKQANKQRRQNVKQV